MSGERITETDDPRRIKPAEIDFADAIAAPALPAET